MKLLINIPNDEYKSIISGSFDTTGYFKANLRNAFKDGTPLDNTLKYRDSDIVIYNVEYLKKYWKPEISLLLEKEI